jgi:hypothetical protein
VRKKRSPECCLAPNRRQFEFPVLRTRLQNPVVPRPVFAQRLDDSSRFPHILERAHRNVLAIREGSYHFVELNGCFHNYIIARRSQRSRDAQHEPNVMAGPPFSAARCDLRHRTSDEQPIYERLLGVLSEGRILHFGFRLGGREHTLNDAECPGCESVGGEHWPKAHRSFTGATCLGLVHAEKFVNSDDQNAEIVFWCDVCNTRLK